MRFVDTNILLYSISTNPAESAKRDIARDILSRSGIAFSVQVFQEFYHQATRPGRPDALSHPLATDIVKGLMRYPTQPMTGRVMLHAFRIRETTGFSYWDSAILAAALALGCEEVLTEDLSHGQIIEDLRIANPFV